MKQEISDQIFKENNILVSNIQATRQGVQKIGPKNQMSTFTEY